MGRVIKKRFLLGVIISANLWINFFTYAVEAQLPLLPKLSLETLKLEKTLKQQKFSDCVLLDGYCLFKLSDRKSNLRQRIKYTEEQLTAVRKLYLQSEEPIKIFHPGDEQQQNIYVTVENRKIPVLSLYARDTIGEGINLEEYTQQISNNIADGLKTTKEERQLNFINRQAKIAGFIISLMLLANLFLAQKLKLLNQAKLDFSRENQTASLTNQLEQRKKFNLKEVHYRLLQLAQITIWVGGCLIILGLFPYTRPIQQLIFTLLRIPLYLIIIIWVCYILIRLSYAAIAKINTAITNNTLASSYVFNPDTNRRLQVRMNTFSGLFRGIVTCIWGGIGLFTALAIIGINITPLLAGAGVLGLAFSFAAQNLIKDTINGLLIILEDQYAVGDVVTIGEVSGLVENLSLRITQLRDGEGRLITIPNSTINLVANHSNGWSRSDLKIPVDYQVKADLAIKLIEEVAMTMYQDCNCKNSILEPPQILGIEDFAERGFIVRLWFKTEPLKQWDISREFRRRIKNTFEEAGISLPLPQQQIWLINQSTTDN
ncbi:MscS mechanosensitive ion channel [Chondrocystis sp. NIES-4102]|nr:MscS mechanosensitive ion channel [Chondrocystis sp. NIES-4102]